MLDIKDIAIKLGLSVDDIEQYGKYKAKIARLGKRNRSLRQGKLILVSAISPTPLGEGKTTTTIGLGDALTAMGHKTIIALREPSLGPVFGIKGGATGGGLAQVVPMQDINLHFTGDLHAITSANNLLAALIDNHIHQGNTLNIDPRKVVWRRCIDISDRQLRNIVSGLGKQSDGMPRQDGFDISVASEVMAVLCLATDTKDLRTKLGNIVVAYNDIGQSVTARDLKANGAMTALLKDAIKPNLVQTLEGTPALIHGGPFANIAHGCSSLIATKLAMQVGDFVVTEAGFGADLGVEKFVNIKARLGDLQIASVVLVATVKALKVHGGKKDDPQQPDMNALQQGIGNLKRHIDNIVNVFGLSVVVAINRFDSDIDQELQYIKEECDKLGVKSAISQVFAKGSNGGMELAETVVQVCSQMPTAPKFVYELDQPIKDKLHAIATKVYRANGVKYVDNSLQQIRKLQELGFGNLPICVAKTPYSFSDNANKVGAVENFDITIRELRLSAGAGFVVAMAGTVVTMPGLPKVPASQKIDIDDSGEIVGLS